MYAVPVVVGAVVGKQKRDELLFFVPIDAMWGLGECIRCDYDGLGVIRYRLGVVSGDVWWISLVVTGDVAGVSLPVAG
jgi:hypothetical protein